MLTVKLIKFLASKQALFFYPHEFILTLICFGGNLKFIEEKNVNENKNVEGGNKNLLNSLKWDFLI